MHSNYTELSGLRGMYKLYLHHGGISGPGPSHSCQCWVCFLKKKKKIFTLIIISLCGLHILGTKNQEKEH